MNALDEQAGNSRQFGSGHSQGAECQHRLQRLQTTDRAPPATCKQRRQNADGRPQSAIDHRKQQDTGSEQCATLATDDRRQVAGRTTERRRQAVSHGRQVQGAHTETEARRSQGADKEICTVKYDTR